ncbi:MAG: PDZ domain-containing protein [Candidatus Aminicenantes bacterium]
MNTKIKIIVFLVLFLFVLFFSLHARPVSGIADNDQDIQEITKKVFPSVVRVEARNWTRKVATGVVIDKGGYILTTALVSPQEEEIFVTTSEGEKIKAEFLGMDPVTHLALIWAEKKDLPPIKRGKAKDLSPGAWVGIVCISPENNPAVTQGIVSSVSPHFPYNLRLNVWVFPGASGSPVVDGKGNMVGLLRGIYAEDKPVFFEFREKELVGSGYVFSRAEAPSSGMALAVPVAVVEEIFTEIKKKGKVGRGWLGVSIAENEEGRVEIIRVEEKSPAELAKLREGDVILEFEGKEVTSTEMLATEIRKRKPGESVSLKIEREGDTKNIKAKLGEYSKRDIRRELELKFPRLFPPEPPQPPEPPARPFVKKFTERWESRKYIGVYLEELNRELSEYFGLEEGTGLLVSRVTEDSPAAKAGLKVGDVIIKADGQRVESVRELSELIQDKEKGDKIEIEFLRDKKKKSIQVEIEEEKRGRYFYFSRNGDKYADVWDEFKENWERQYQEFQDRYQDDLKKSMEKLNKEFKKISKELAREGETAARRLRDYLRRSKAITI